MAKTRQKWEITFYVETPKDEDVYDWSFEPDMLFDSGDDCELVDVSIVKK